MIGIHKPDIVGIVEVKPKNSRFAVEECELALGGFELFHNLSSEGRGVALYVRTELGPSLCEAVDSEYKEYILVESKQHDGSKLLIGLVYRSPNSTPENTEKLNELMRKISGQGASHLMVMGDFNFPEIDWSREDWSDKWLLKFHPEKCSVIKLGVQKSEGKYFMRKGQEQQLELRESGVERDLGVMMDYGLVFKEHVAYCTAKANKCPLELGDAVLQKKEFVQLFLNFLRIQANSHVLPNTPTGGQQCQNPSTPSFGITAVKYVSPHKATGIYPTNRNTRSGAGGKLDFGGTPSRSRGFHSSRAKAGVVPSDGLSPCHTDEFVQRGVSNSSITPAPRDGELTKLDISDSSSFPSLGRPSNGAQASPRVVNKLDRHKKKRIKPTRVKVPTEDVGNGGNCNTGVKTTEGATPMLEEKALAVEIKLGKACGLQEERMMLKRLKDEMKRTKHVDTNIVGEPSCIGEEARGSQVPSGDQAPGERCCDESRVVPKTADSKCVTALSEYTQGASDPSSRQCILLTVKTWLDDGQVEPQYKSGLPDLLYSAHNCVYFAISVLLRSRHLIKLLDRSILRLLAENSRVQLFCPSLQEDLNKLAHSLPTHLSPKQTPRSPMKGVPFQIEIDNRSSFPDNTTFHVFKKQRDIFYELLREWECEHESPDWSFSYCLGDAIRSLLQLGPDPCNTAHLARLFVAQLLCACESGQKELKQPDDGDVLSALKRRQPEKFERLQERLVTPSSTTSSVNPAPSFPGVQQFFKDFIMEGASPSFSALLEEHLIAKISDLLCLTSNRRESPSSSQSSLLLRQVGVLGKFLGLLWFAPYCSPLTLPQLALAHQVTLRSKVHLRLPLCSVLRSCARQGCLVAAVLLCVQLLSVSDVAALHTTHLQTAVFALMHVYKLALCACTCKEIILESQEKSTKPSRELTENQCSVLERRHGRRSLYSSDIAIIAEDESDVSLGKETTKLERQSEIIGEVSLFLRLLLGWLFDLPVFPDGLFYAELPNTSIDIKQEEDCYPVYGDADATSSINTRVNSVTEPPRCFVTPLKCRTRDNVTAVTSPDVTMTLTDTPHRGEELVEGVCPPSPPPAPHRFDEHIRVDSHLLKEWCPQLAPLQGMLRNALDGSGDRASHGSVRKIAPLSALPHRRQPDSPSATTDGSASEGKKPSNKQDLSQHSLQLQDRFDSEFGLHESSALEPEISIQDCAKFSSTDEVEAVAKRELLQALTSLRGQVAQQCVQHLQQQLHQQQQLLRMLLPSDISDKAVAVCCGVVVRSCSERVTAWLRNDLVPTTPPSLFSPVTRTTLRRVLTKLDLNVTPNWSLTSFLEAATCEIASPAMGVVTVPAFDVSQTVATITANVNSIDGTNECVADKSQSPVLSNSNFIISHEENAAKSSNRQNRFLKDVDFNSSGLLDYTLDLANISATNVFAEDKAAFAHVSCGKEMHDKDAPVPSLLKIEMKALAKALLNSLTIPGLPQFKSYLRQPYSTTTSCQESAVDLPVRTHNGVLRELSNVAPPLPVTAEQLRVLAVALRDCVTRRADITSPLLRGFKTLSVDIITTACAAYPDLVTPSVLDDYIALWGPDAPLESPPSLPTTVLAPRVLHLIELRSRSGEVCSSKGLQQLLHACVDASLLQREMLHDKAVALLQHSWLPVVLQELSSLVQSLCDAQDDDAVVSFLPWLCQEMENLSDPE
ncbi:hypothetical protein HAZT_HAZT005004 [Hyalella azteca]|uniref:Codanin-1 C-terminal domain-containing protein n=1 Tax=Hyalella azteca TaxID=294128 RepID=A0A6A0GTS1_HYAAZ|nr:hypothetical protein HAZT_HAZT005004 [Hyalella azteca]